MIIKYFKSKIKFLIYKFPRILLIRSFLYEKLNFVFNFYVNHKLNKFEIKKKIINKKDKKKILLLTDQIKPGGSERQLLRLASHLVKKDYNVLIVNLVPYEKDWLKKLNFFRSQISNKVKIKTLNLSNLNDQKIKNQITFFYKKKYKNFSDGSFLDFFNNREKILFFKFYEILVKFKPYVVHSFLDFPNIINGICGLSVGVKKIILSTRNLPPYNFIWHKYYFKKIYKFLLSNRNIFLVNNSKKGTEEYSTWLKLKKNKSKITFNIFDFKKIKKIKDKRDNEKVTIGMVSRLAPEKNVEYFIEIANRLINEDKKYHFKLYGEGYLKRSLINKIERLNLKKNFTLMGVKKDIISEMQKMDVCFLTSKYEGTPNVLLEAQSVGTPIITTDVGGTSECIVKNYSGYLINGKNLDKDLIRIKKLLKNENFLKKRNVSFIKNKLKKFSSKEVINKIILLYA